MGCNVEEPKIDFSYTSEGILKGEIGVTTSSYVKIIKVGFNQSLK